MLAKITSGLTLKLKVPINITTPNKMPFENSLYFGEILGMTALIKSVTLLLMTHSWYLNTTPSGHDSWSSNLESRV